MRPTFKDLKTGATAGERPDSPEASVYWWLEGNGSCDCNRVYMFPGLEEELEELHGENTCYGCKRLIVVDVEGDLEGWDKAVLITELNREYPES